MKSWLLYVIIFFFCYIWAPSYSSGMYNPYVTDKKVEVLIAKGDKQFRKGFYFQAIQFYQEVLVLEAGHLYAHYQLAECYRHLFEYQKAKEHYQRVRQTRVEQYPLSGYYEGLMHKFLGDYGRAVKLFEEFIIFGKNHTFEDREHYLQMASLEKEGSFFALENAMKPKGNFDFMRLPEPVNTSYNDYAASPFLTDSSIAITSTRKESKGSNLNDQYGEFFSDLYLFSRDTTNEWVDISRQSSFANINTDFSEGTGVFSKDQKTFIFTGCYQEGYCHLFKSVFEQGKWQKPVSLGEEINHAGYDSKQPGLSDNGDSLFFVSDRPGGYGMLDIWLSVLSADGQWQTPVNLGAKINTPQNELAPFYLAAEQMLFFSSNGHQGYGSYDIFVSSCCEDASPAVINLGIPFNSSKDDLYLSLGKHKGYMSSNRENADGNFDIFSFNTTTDNAELVSLTGGGALLQHYDEVLQFFSQEDKMYYEQLPLEKKEKIQQAVEARSFQKAIASRAAMSSALSLYYESLSTEEKERIERLALGQKSFLLNDHKEQILEEDYFYYKNLSPEEKAKVKQIIEAKAFQKILQESKKFNKEIDLFYEHLPLEERKKIDRAIEQRRYALASHYQENIISDPEDIFFYQSLPTEQKEQISRFIAAKVLQKNIDDTSELKDELLWVYEELPSEAKESVKRIIQSKTFAAKAMGNTTAVKDLFGKNSISLADLAFSHPDNIIIEGKIVNNNKPAEAVRVVLAGEQNDKEISVLTDQHGVFRFTNINYQKSQKILFDQKSSFTKLSAYAIDELKVIVLQDTIIEETFDNIYFDTDRYTINDSSKIILDSLASFHFRYPDVKVEITAYADTVGGIGYNRELSRKRALEAYNYLLDKNVDADAVYIQAKGKEIPKEGKDLQYSRRIEFDLKGISTSYNPTREIFIIAAYPKLADIAQKYQLTLQQLMDMNPQFQGKPAPFTPIRIVANQK